MKCTKCHSITEQAEQKYIPMNSVTCHGIHGDNPKNVKQAAALSMSRDDIRVTYRSYNGCFGEQATSN